MLRQGASPHVSVASAPTSSSLTSIEQRDDPKFLATSPSTTDVKKRKSRKKDEDPEWRTDADDGKKKQKRPRSSATLFYQSKSTTKTGPQEKNTKYGSGASSVPSAAVIKTTETKVSLAELNETHTKATVEQAVENYVSGLEHRWLQQLVVMLKFIMPATDTWKQSDEDLHLRETIPLRPKGCYYRGFLITPGKLRPADDFINAVFKNSVGIHSLFQRTTTTAFVPLEKLFGVYTEIIKEDSRESSQSVAVEHRVYIFLAKLKLSKPYPDPVDTVRSSAQAHTILCTLKTAVMAKLATLAASASVTSTSGAAAMPVLSLDATSLVDAPPQTTTASTLSSAVATAETQNGAISLPAPPPLPPGTASITTIVGLTAPSSPTTTPPSSVPMVRPPSPSGFLA